MRQLLLFTISLFFFNQTLAQTPVTAIEFDQYVYDFGKIDEVKGEVSHTFKYRNVGKKPFVIYNISTSCGCTIPTYSRKPLGVGDGGEIKIVFDPTNQPGRIEKRIVVSGNIEGEVVELKIKALVAPRPRTIEDDFPVMFSDGIRLADIVIDGYQVANTKSSTFELDLINNSTKQAVVQVVNSTLPGWIKASVAVPFLKGKERSKILVTINPNGNLWGKQSITIPVLVNGKRQFVDVIFNVTFVENFGVLSKTDLQFIPRALLSSSFYHFSTVNSGEKLEYKLKIKNNGVKPLIIRHVDHSNKVAVNVSKNQISEGDEATIIISLDSSEPEAAAETVRFITNDPIKPVVEFKVMANIK